MVKPSSVWAKSPSGDGGPHGQPQVVLRWVGQRDENGVDWLVEVEELEWVWLGTSRDNCDALGWIKC